MSNLVETVGLGRARVILADPPWSFRTYSSGPDAGVTPHRSAEDHYATMSAEELKSLPVGLVAHRDAMLFMWVIRSHLPEALELGRAWGFEYKTRVFVWDKGDNIGMGYWTRTQAEDVWLFTRGNVSPASRAVREIIRAPRREHSRKPDEIYERVEELTGMEGGLELFARASRPGWLAWGLEVGKFD